jgi:hypothetical protein
LRNGTFGLSGCGEGGLIGFITAMIKKHIHDLEANLAKAAGDPASTTPPETASRAWVRGWSRGGGGLFRRHGRDQ